MWSKSSKKYTPYAYVPFFTTKGYYQFREVNIETDDVMAIASVPWIKYLKANRQVLGHDNIGVNFSS